MTQHSGLTAERWAKFSLAQQILQIGAEMQRALKFLRPDRMKELHACYERALLLVDLTVAVQENPHLRRELLLGRDIVAGLYVSPELDVALHRQALRALLQLHPESAKQVAVLGL